MRCPRLVLAAALFAAPSVAQATWTNLTGPTDPPDRTEVGMVSDLTGAWLFGGLDGRIRTAYNDLWRFDGTAWTQFSPTTSPPVRSRFAITWDLVRGEMVIFGGDSTYPVGGPLGDTWTWNGTAWTQHTPANAPSPRIHARMAYDLANARAILFGGRGPSSETWAWDGAAWTLLNPATVPPAREQTHMATNLDTGEIVMFGGAGSAVGGILGDTWIWNGTDWRQVVTATIPGGTGIRNGAITYDSLRRRVVLYGGVAGTAPTRPGTPWEFDGVDWVQRTPATAPSARNGGGFAYVQSLAKTYAFAGYNGATPLGGTWCYQTNAVAGVQSYGTGCPNSAGVPQLTASGPPWLGDTMTLQMAPLPPAAFAYVLLGFSRTSWNGVPLPASLASFGFAACSLLQSADDTLLAPAGSLAITVPNSPALIGLGFYLQGASVEFPPLRLGLSQGLDCVVGAR